jgi:hypothetical protein
LIDELYRLALDTLRNHCDAAGMPYTEDDGDLQLAGHRLGLSITFEGFSRQGNQLIAPLDVQIHLDGDSGDRFRVGTLGIGDDRLSAMRSAIEEWHLLAASAVLTALGADVDKRRKPPLRNLAGWELFPGRAGIRGTLPNGLNPGGIFYRQLLDVLHKHVVAWPHLDVFQLRSIFVMATSAEGQHEIQAAVDGFLQPNLVADLTALPWPSSAEAYLFKQLLVLRGLCLKTQA